VVFSKASPSMPEEIFRAPDLLNITSVKCFPDPSSKPLVEEQPKDD